MVDKHESLDEQTQEADASHDAEAPNPDGEVGELKALFLVVIILFATSIVDLFGGRFGRRASNCNWRFCRG